MEVYTVPLIIPPTYYLAKLRWRLSGDPQEMICTIGVQPRDDPERDPLNLAQGIYDAWAGAWPNAHLGNQWAFVGVDLVGSNTGEGAVVVSWDQINQGTFGEAVMPQNTSILIKKKTVLGGRQNQGRMYLPSGYLSDGGVNGTGEILGSEVTKFQANCNQFLTNMDDISQPLPNPQTDARVFIFHNDAALGPTEISQLTVDPIIATQRQRLRR